MNCCPEQQSGKYVYSHHSQTMKSQLIFFFLIDFQMIFFVLVWLLASFASAQIPASSSRDDSSTSTKSKITDDQLKTTDQFILNTQEQVEKSKSSLNSALSNQKYLQKQRDQKSQQLKQTYLSINRANWIVSNLQSRISMAQSNTQVIKSTINSLESISHSAEGQKKSLNNTLKQIGSLKASLKKGVADLDALEQKRKDFQASAVLLEKTVGINSNEIDKLKENLQYSTWQLEFAVFQKNKLLQTKSVKAPSSLSKSQQGGCQINEDSNQVGYYGKVVEVSGNQIVLQNGSKILLVPCTKIESIRGTESKPKSGDTIGWIGYKYPSGQQEAAKIIAS